MADSKQPNLPKSGLRTDNLNLIIIFIALGIFATTLPQPQVLGKIPLQHLLKSELHVSRTEMSSFFFMCGLFWYLKPIAGILTDAFPLFKTRRRHYALFSALFAGIAWVGLGFAPHNYQALLIAAIVVNLFMVMLSTVAGAVLVEMGQSTGQVGRLTSIRQVISSVCSLIQGPLGGWLATGSIGLASGVNSVFLFAFIPVVYFTLRESPLTGRNTEAFTNAKGQLRIMFASRTFWWALVFITLYYFAPGFGTMMYYRQNDVLKFDQPHIGYLGSLGGAGGILGALTYGFVVRRLPLGKLLFTGVVIGAITTFFYLAYNSWQSAMVIDFLSGLCGGFAEVALIDLAARATPAGCEGLGYSLILSFRNVALFGADLLGSKLADDYKWSWDRMVLLNGGSTVIVLFLIPLIPAVVRASKDAASAKQSAA